MSDHDDSHTVQTLDGALRGAEVGGRTRRWLLERAAVGAAGLAAGAALAPGGSATASNGGNSVPAFGRVAVSTEALTAVLLTELLRRVDQYPEVPAAAKAVIEGAYAAEVDHLRFTSENWPRVATNQSGAMTSVPHTPVTPRIALDGGTLISQLRPILPALGRHSS